MMPLMLAEKGEENIIKKVGGSTEVKHHLEELGFTVGSSVIIVSTLGGNIIAKVRDTRVAINEDLARRIMV